LRALELSEDIREIARLKRLKPEAVVCRRQQNFVTLGFLRKNVGWWQIKLEVGQLGRLSRFFSSALRRQLI
jgi:hypothetical protein